jgi:hypothetical protein
MKIQITALVAASLLALAACGSDDPAQALAKLGYKQGHEGRRQGRHRGVEADGADRPGHAFAGHRR